MMEWASNGPGWWWSMLAAGHLPLDCVWPASICICISLNQTPGDAVARRISVLGLVFYSLRPGPDPTAGLVRSPVDAHPSSSLVVLGVTVMDPIQNCR